MKLSLNHTTADRLVQLVNTITVTEFVPGNDFVDKGVGESLVSSRSNIVVHRFGSRVEDMRIGNLFCDFLSRRYKTKSQAILSVLASHLSNRHSIAKFNLNIGITGVDGRLLRGKIETSNLQKNIVIPTGTSLESLCVPPDVNCNTRVKPRDSRSSNCYHSSSSYFGWRDKHFRHPYVDPKSALIVSTPFLFEIN
ncbi:hypothetical protein CLF_107668 [Clonorchis sinensis]|uniref:Uncharacterized protein n=1 Tax=Clonorchis sinensis TaxID=79923 RepID=G7YQX3_CLOSI|nr:hypothetical protein CLF_107668 [Clonorchis sinensis]